MRSRLNVQRLEPLLVSGYEQNAPGPFTSRLSPCRLTFTKPPIPPNRSVPSRLSKASTTSRFAATRKLAKERGVWSRLVTTFLFAENLLVLRSAQSVHTEPSEPRLIAVWQRPPTS